MDATSSVEANVSVFLIALRTSNVGPAAVSPVHLPVLFVIHPSMKQYDNNLSERRAMLPHLHTGLRGVFCLGVDMNDSSRYTNKHRL